MKLITFFLFVALIQVSAKGYSQKVTINRTNTNLEEVLVEINRQTGYSYSANSEALNNTRRFDIYKNNADLNDVIAYCINGQSLTFSIKDRIIVIKSNREMGNGTSPNPPITVNGRILNEADEPVIATIQEKGTTNAVSSNDDGFFELKRVNPDAILIISSVSIRTVEVKVGGKKNLSIIKVETSVGTQSGVIINSKINNGIIDLEPNKTNSSIVVITKEIIREQKGPNIIDRIIGNANGLLKNTGKVDAKGKSNPLMLGGINTINASTYPLIILDKFPFEGNINNIDPNDVETVTILKDAAATAIYGARGANGVIVITTQKGRYNQKASVEVNSSLTITEQPDLYYLPRISSSDYIDVEQFLFRNGYSFSNSYYSALTPAVEIFQKSNAGTITAIDSANQIDALKQIDSRQQMDKYFYSNALLQQYSLNVRGGGNNIAWIIAGSYNKDISSLDAKSDKINFRLSNTYKISKDAEIVFGTYYTNSTSKSGKPAPDELGIRKAPYISFADANGSPLAISNTYRTSFTDTVGGGKLLSWKYYPLDDYKHDVTKTRTEQIVADIEFRYRIIKEIGVTLNYQYQKQKGDYRRLADLESFYARDVINTYTNLNAPITSPELIHPIPVGSILQTSSTSLSSQSLRALLQGNKTKGDHSISGVVGIEIRNIAGESGVSSTLYGYKDNPTQFAIIDYNRSFPDFFMGSPIRIPGGPYLSSNTINRNVSGYANLAYVYKERYSLNLSGRKDASNVFGLKSNDKWNPLWAAGLGWVISGEDFYHYKQRVPYVRLRTTWGYSGNVDLSNTPIVTLRYLGAVNDAGNSYAVVWSPTNRTLRWEKVRQLNFGIDFNTIKNTISGSIEYYTKKGTDLYGETPFDYTTFGLSGEITENVANIKGRGIDIQIQTININSKAFNWTSNFIFNYNTSKTSRYFSTTAQKGSNIVGRDGSKITPVTGKPLYAIASYKWGGLDQAGNPQGYLNGKLSTDYPAILQNGSSNGIYNSDIIYNGSANPTVFGSVSNRISWKKLFLSINIVFKAGYYFRKPTISYQSLVETGAGHGDFTKRWQRPGDENFTNIPSFVYPVDGSRDAFYRGSEVNVLRADNVRINYVDINYSPGKNIHLYGNIANLGIIWRANDQKIDPDYSNIIPPPKAYTIGFRMEF